jgi:hypothetical protein
VQVRYGSTEKKTHTSAESAFPAWREELMFMLNPGNSTKFEDNLKALGRRTVHITEQVILRC